jgi:hypothetical protein
MEESIVHETNFRESMKMLVVSDIVKALDTSISKEAK